MVGLFGQRLWFYGKTQNYTDKLMIHESCIGCGLCATLCPMHNISISNGKAMSGKIVRCAIAVLVVVRKSNYLIRKRSERTVSI